MSPFRAGEHGIVWRASDRASYPVCRMLPEVGERATPKVAELMNVGSRYAIIGDEQDGETGL